MFYICTGRDLVRPKRWISIKERFGAENRKGGENKPLQQQKVNFDQFKIYYQHQINAKTSLKNNQQGCSTSVLYIRHQSRNETTNVNENEVAFQSKTLKLSDNLQTCVDSEQLNNINFNKYLDSISFVEFGQSNLDQNERLEAILD